MYMDSIIQGNYERVLVDVKIECLQRLSRNTPLMKMARQEVVKLHAKVDEVS
jgi:hypothetical protein